MAFEPVKIRTNSGLLARDVECFVLGAEERESKRSKEARKANPDAAASYYYQLYLHADEAGKGDRIYAMADRADAEAAADAMRAAGSAVPAVVDLSIGKGGFIRVERIEVG